MLLYFQESLLLYLLKFPMHLPHYEIKSDETGFTFYIFSEGPKGKIRKIVQFSQLSTSLVYNLSLCDYNSVTEDVDDSIVTDNGDTEKVLATVAEIIYTFFDAFPELWVYATGNTPARTRLYRMGINKYYNTAKKDFDILGEISEGWETYRKEEDYKGFLVRRKRLNLIYEEK
jgi:hypothetical protein